MVKELPDDEFETLKDKPSIPNKLENLYPNQFVRFTKQSDPSISCIMRYISSSNTLIPFIYYHGQEVFGIKSRNYEQEMAFELLLDDNVKLVSLSGIAGTGKTLLAMAAGLQKVIEENKYARLVISRPIFPLGKDLGYLPGTKTEKFNPWMQPIYDNMDLILSRHDHTGSVGTKSKSKTSIDDFIDYGYLELEPLTYIRGRSLPDQFMIIDEAQNLTPHEMNLLS